MDKLKQITHKDFQKEFNLRSIGSDENPNIATYQVKNNISLYIDNILLYQFIYLSREQEVALIMTKSNEKKLRKN